MKPYYYILRVGGSHPRIKHPTLDSAHTEAMRLAAQHPGDSFEILQCLATTRTINPQTFWMDGVIPPNVCAMHRQPCSLCGQPTGRCEEDSAFADYDEDHELGPICEPCRDSFRENETL